jgi:hypothetical protein
MGFLKVKISWLHVSTWEKWTRLYLQRDNQRGFNASEYSSHNDSQERCFPGRPLTKLGDISNQPSN